MNKKLSYCLGIAIIYHLSWSMDHTLKKCKQLEKYVTFTDIEYIYLKAPQISKPENNTYVFTFLGNDQSEFKKYLQKNLETAPQINLSSQIREEKIKFIARIEKKNEKDNVIKGKNAHFEAPPKDIFALSILAGIWNKSIKKTDEQAKATFNALSQSEDLNSTIEAWEFILMTSLEEKKNCLVS